MQKIQKKRNPKSQNPITQKIRRFSVANSTHSRAQCYRLRRAWHSVERATALDDSTIHRHRDANVLENPCPNRCFGYNIRRYVGDSTICICLTYRIYNIADLC